MTNLQFNFATRHTATMCWWWKLWSCSHAELIHQWI